MNVIHEFTGWSIITNRLKWYFFCTFFQTSGDLNLARRCLRLCLSSDGSHGAALNNLAVISTQLGQFNKAKSYLTAAKAVLSNSDEVEQNIKLISKYAWITKCSICFIAVCLKLIVCSYLFTAKNCYSFFYSKSIPKKGIIRKDCE